MEQFGFTYQPATILQLPARIQALIAAAADATGTAYAPYSNFKVGAAVLLANGTIRTGSNHENASYPAGICAERSVLSTINPNDRQQLVTAIAVTYHNSGDSGDPLSPCGICRQTILELQLAQGAVIAVYMCSPDGRVICVEDAASLLPFYFSSRQLPGG